MQRALHILKREEIKGVPVNFLIDREEVVFVTGLARGETFKLQIAGKLTSVSEKLCKAKFDLFAVLGCVAELHNLPPTDYASIEAYARIVVELRLKKKLQRQKQK